MALQFLLLREIIVVIAAIIASYTDLKTGLIPDVLTYLLIGIGIVMALLEPNAIEIYFLAGFVFTLGYLLYALGKIGGGDVKLFTGISLMIPFFHDIPFILAVVFYAALSAVLVLSVYYVLMYAKKGIDWKLNEPHMKKVGVILVIFIAYFVVIANTGFYPPQFLLILGIPLLSGLVFMALEPGIKKTFFLKHAAVSSLEEDELLAIEYIKPALLKKLDLQGKGILEKAMVAQLKKMHVKTIPVYRNLPKFGPFIFVGVIVALAYPELLLKLFLFV